MLLDLFRQRFGRTPIGLDRDTAARGEAVFKDGRVLSAVETSPGLIEGEVEGPQGEVYRSQVRLAAHGAVIQVIAQCDCPQGGSCEHGAAALLNWLLDQKELQARQTQAQARTERDERETVTALGGARTARQGLPEDGAVPPDTGQSSEAPDAVATAQQTPLRLPAQPPSTPNDAADSASPALIPGYERLQLLHWVRGLRALKLPDSPQTPRTQLHYVLRNEDRRPSLQVFRVRRGEDGQPLPPEPYRGLATQATDPPAYWDEVDVMAAAMLTRSTPLPGGVLLDSPRAAQVILQLAQTGRLFLDQLPGTQLSAMLQRGAPRATRVDWIATDPPDAASALRLGLRVDPEAEVIFTAQPCWLDRTIGQIGALTDPPPAELVAWLRSAPAVPAQAAEDVALALHAQLVARPDLRRTVPQLSSHPVRERPGVPRPVIGLFSSSSTPSTVRGGKTVHGPRDRLAVSYSVEYAGRRLEPMRSASLGIRDDEGPVLLICDAAAERAGWERLHADLQRLALDEPAMRLTAETAPDAASRPRTGSGWLTAAMLPATSVAAARIKFDVVPRLRELGWDVVDESTAAVRLVQVDEVDIALHAQNGGRARDAGAGGGWFELQSGIQVAGSRIDLAPVLADVIAQGGFDAWRDRHCPDGQLWMRVSQDEVLRLDAARIEPLARVVTDWAELSEADAPGTAPRIRLDGLAAAALAAGRPSVAVPPSLEPLRLASESFEGLPAVTPPPEFRATLRPYQLQGLAWLQFIAGTGTGGVLADDMGLGKTVQVLAHLECERAAGRLRAPVLVVAPTSLVFNWQDESARHAPSLKVLALHGAARATRFDEIDAHDIVITSYALLPRDLDAFVGRRWHAVIADEAHLVKNSRTRAAAAIRSLNAGHRLALTGTPLENHLGELWSVMQFVVPGLLGREEAFKTRFRTPIERRTSGPEAADRLASLNRRIRPFLLRRTKAAVLSELPARTDIVHRVELGAEQRDLYESVRVAMDERVRLALADAGVERSHIVVLDALLKLRQVCCDPALLSMPAAQRVSASAKREALIELLEQLTEEGRRVLVFSQFTSMLDRIEVAIDAHPRLAKVVRSRLDGDTADRRGAVDAFQQGDAQIFLLSLKAGGVGLNLTAADTVIHYDPWWNPAVESQATDRAHRIGQQRAVFVYKLIAANTIEERILELQSKKGELSQAVLEGALDGTGLSRDDLMGLFELGA